MNGCGYIVPAGGKAAEATPDEAEAARATAGLVWIHLDGRDKAAMDWLHAGDLPHAVIASLTAVETRPRVDLIGDGALLNLRGLAIDDADAPDGLVSIRLWADKGRVISVSFVPLAAIRPVRETMAAGRIRDPGDLITAMAVTITLALDPEVAKLGDTLDDCEAELVPGVGIEMRHTIGKTRAHAIRYRRFVAPQREALDRLSRLEVDWLDEEDRIHVRAAADRFARMAEELEAVRERAALMHEQLTDLRAEQIDQRTLLLAIAALIFLPITFVTGLFGMNVDGLPFAHHPHAFWWVTGFCIAVAVGVTGWFVRAHWLKG